MTHARRGSLSGRFRRLSEREQFCTVTRLGKQYCTSCLNAAMPEKADSALGAVMG